MKWEWAPSVTTVKTCSENYSRYPRKVYKPTLITTNRASFLHQRKISDSLCLSMFGFWPCVTLLSPAHKCSTLQACNRHAVDEASDIRRSLDMHCHEVSGQDGGTSSDRRSRDPFVTVVDPCPVMPGGEFAQGSEGVEHVVVRRVLEGAGGECC